MDPIDWAALLQIAPDVAVAALFGYFILRLLDRNDKQNDRRDGEWRNFLLSARESYLSSISNIASEIKALATAMIATHDMLSRHDDWSKSEAIRRDAVTAATAAAVASEAVKVAAEVASRAAERAIAKERQSGGG